MKQKNYWRTIFATPSHARTATLAMVAMWMIAAIWGWCFVEPTVLRDSQAARDYVDWATKVFPWLENIRKLVPQAEKGLYLHCVYTVALAPLSIICTWFIGKRPEAIEFENSKSFFEVCVSPFIAFAGLVILIFMYYGLLQPSFGKLHRTGYAFVMSHLTVPIFAPFFIMGIWSCVTGILYFTHLSIRRFKELTRG